MPTRRGVCAPRTKRFRSTRRGFALRVEGEKEEAMKPKHVAPLVLSAAIAGVFLSQMQPASSFDPLAQDPGVRDGAAGAGNPLDGLSSTQAAFFQAGAADFAEVEDVPDGLGPRMNLDSCGGCHIQPALGGSSPHPLFGTPPFGNVPNPQVAFASKGGGND